MYENHENYHSKYDLWATVSANMYIIGSFVTLALMKN